MTEQEEPDNSILLNLFPSELWTKILHNVHARNFISVADSTPFLKSILEPLKTIILFSDVVEILFFQRYLTNTDLMLTRRVCQAWKKAVDFGFNNWEFDPDRYHKFFRLSFQVGVIPPGHNFADSNKLIKFIEHFDGSENPFLTRSVSIVFTWNVDLLPTFYEALFTFLHKFGHHLYYCYLISEPINDLRAQNEFLVQLGDILKLLPNLRRLQFGSRLIQEITTFELKESSSFKIPQLQHLIQRGLPVAVLRELVHNNQQIRAVQSLCQTCEHIPIYLEEMPNLEALAMDIQSEEEFLIFRNSQVNCRLTKLNIQMWTIEMEWTNIFAVLNHHFSGTLEELCISLPDCESMCNRPNLAEDLILPKLQKLKMSMSKPTSLDFILPVRNHLEAFSILVHEFYDSTRSTIDGTISFFQCGDSMYQSNIWSLFPKLDKVYAKFGCDPVFESNRVSWMKLTQK